MAFLPSLSFIAPSLPWRISIHWESSRAFLFLFLNSQSSYFLLCLLLQRVFETSGSLKVDAAITMVSVYSGETSSWLKLRKIPKAKRGFVLWEVHNSPCYKPGSLPQTAAVLSFQCRILVRCHTQERASEIWNRCYAGAASFTQGNSGGWRSQHPAFWKSEYPQLPEMWMRNKHVPHKINL